MLCDELDAANPATGRVVRDAIFWPQLSGITVQGRPMLPVCPWTGYAEPDCEPAVPAPPQAGVGDFRGTDGEHLRTIIGGIRLEPNVSVDRRRVTVRAITRA